MHFKEKKRTVTRVRMKSVLGSAPTSVHYQNEVSREKVLEGPFTIAKFCSSKTPSTVTVCQTSAKQKTTTMF